jgi:hypothetical protein
VREHPAFPAPSVFARVVLAKPGQLLPRERAHLRVLRSRVPDAMQREAMLRRSGTHLAAGLDAAADPGSAAHHFVLRSARDTGLPITQSLPFGQLHRNMGRGADGTLAAVAVGDGLLVLDEGFEIEKKLFGKHG